MRYSRGQIIDAALQRVGNTTQSLIAQARIRLNRILQDLHQQWDWPFLWMSTPITIPPGQAWAYLPDDFVKPEDEQSLHRVTVGGQPARGVLQELNRRKFFEVAGNRAWDSDQGIAGILETSPSGPRVYCINYNSTPPFVRVWPPCDTAVVVRVRYKMLPPDCSLDDPNVYDNDIPTFPFDNLLVDLLFEWAQSYEVDPRRAESLQVNASLVERVRGVAFPDRSYPGNIPLDPLFFSTPWQGND